MQTILLERYTNSLPITSRRSYTAHARRFLTWLDDRQPDGEAVREYMSYLERKGYSDGTRYQLWSILRRLYIVNNLPWDFRRGDAPLVREQEVYAPALAPEDIKDMVDITLGRHASASSDPKPIHRLYLCLSTVWGLRREEMAQMKPEYIDLESRLVFVETVHRGRQRYHSIPPHVVPHLQDLREHVSVSRLSKFFGELKAMIGLEGALADELGWHSIRRACIKAAFEVGLSEAEIHSYYRWKRGGSSIALRYGSSRVVGRAGERHEVGLEDRRIDDRFYALHPFVAFWR